MKESVLFSPVGHSDPVSGNYDGSFLHIVRCCRPKRAYLFMSAEVAELDDKDNRFEFFVKNLCAKEGFLCEVIKLINRELTKPNDFEAFYEPFEREIDGIVRDNPGCDVLVNLSSGTPQMKNACNLICALSRHILIPLQVDTPGGGGTRKMELDLEREWETLEGNCPGRPLTKRLREVESVNLKARFTKEYIATLVSGYDYSGALSVASNIDNYLSRDARRLLESARRRLAQDKSFVDNLAADEKKALLPIEEEEAKTLYEYLLYLGTKQAKCELMDFVRGISPVLTDLYVAYLKNRCGVAVKELFCEYDDKKKTYMVRAQKIKEYSNELWSYLCQAKNGREFEDSFLSGSNLCHFINWFSADSGLNKKIKMLKEYEQRIRNKAAHEIVCVDEEWMEENGPQRKKADKKRTPQPSRYILGLLRSVFIEAFPSAKADWDVYEEMNAQIISYL